MIFSSRRYLQKTNEWILLYYYESSYWLVFVSFLEEIEDTKTTFRNYLTFSTYLIFTWSKHFTSNCFSKLTTWRTKLMTIIRQILVWLKNISNTSISLKIICKTRLKKLRIPCSIEDKPPLLCTDVDEADEYKFIKKFVPNFPIMFDANHFDHETFKSLFR